METHRPFQNGLPDRILSVQGRISEKALRSDQMSFEKSLTELGLCNRSKVICGLWDYDQGKKQ